MSEYRGSADDGIWMVLCLLALLLLAGAGGFMWFQQRQANQMLAAEQMAREAAEVNRMQAVVAMEQAAAAERQAQAVRAETAAVEAGAAAEAPAGGQPLVPELYINQDLWQPVESLAEAGPGALVFTIDPETGDLRFGDGEQGAAPPDGPATLQATYSTAGGGTVTVSLPATDLRASQIRAVQDSSGVLRLEVRDPP